MLKRLKKELRVGTALVTMTHISSVTHWLIEQAGKRARDGEAERRLKVIEYAKAYGISEIAARQLVDADLSPMEARFAVGTMGLT